MTLTRQEVYAFSTEAPSSVALLGDNLYVGTSQSPSDDGVREIVDATTPVSDSLLDSTDEIIDPEYVVNHDGTLYALARFDELIYTVSSGGYTVWSDPLGSGQAWKPMFRPADDSCWVNYFDNTLVELDASGSFVATHTFGGSVELGGGVWHDDLLYLTDVDDDRIMVYDPSDDSLSVVIAASAFGYSFSVGADLAIWNDRIYTSSGTLTGPIWSVALDGTDRQDEYEDPTGSWLPLAFSVINGFLYVASPLPADLRVWRMVSAGGWTVGRVAWGSRGGWH